MLPGHRGARRRSSAGLFIPALCALLCVAIAPFATTAAGQAAPDRLAQAAAAISHVRRAADALGMSDQRPISSIAWESDGTLYSPNQGASPGAPAKMTLRHRHFADFEAGITYLVLDFSGGESSFSRSAALRHDSGSADLLELMAPSPHSMVRLLADRPEDLTVVRSGAGGSVVAGPAIGRTVELEFGPDGLPRALTYVIEDQLFGDSIRRFEYLDYRRVGGLLVPGRVRQTDAGRPAHDMRIAGVATDAPRPQWSAGLAPSQAHPPAGSDGFRAERIAPGIHLLKQIGGADYHALGVELADGWMLLETPQALGDGAEVRNALRSISDKPLTHVVPTHHHDDHSSGVTAFAEDPVTVLAAPGNVEYFETMLSAQRDFSRPEVRAHVSAAVPDQRIGPVQLLHIAALPHVADMFVFYFPDHRFLFHSDLGRFDPDARPEPARPQTCALLALIEDRGLQVDRIYSGHGHPGTVDQLRQAIALRDTPCPGA